jgi:hypothetical protein
VKDKHLKDDSRLSSAAIVDDGRRVANVSHFEDEA